MDVLQQTLEKAIASAPTIVLEKLIAKKLSNQGITVPKTLRRKVAKHILSGSREPFRYSGRTQPEVVTLTFDETDTDELARAIDLFCEIQLRQAVSVTAERISRQVLKISRYAGPRNRNFNRPTCRGSQQNGVDLQMGYSARGRGSSA
jgi:hypothetical protein